MAISCTYKNEETEAYDYVTEINGTPLTYSSVYDEETEVSKYVINGVAEITSDTDDFGRTENVYLKDSSGEELLTCTYSYIEKTVYGELRTSEYISSMTYSGLNSNSYTYTYDANGNIISVSDGTYTTTYVYDSLNQLTRENNQKLNKTWVYTYDVSGNILSKSQYAYTTGTLGTAVDTINYVYGNTNWGDQLTSYDGTTISYDAQGNPLNWRDGMIFTWEGRQLESVTDSNGTVYSFDYNSDGIRTKKTITYDDGDQTVYEYILDDSNKIIALKTNDSIVATYYYDESDSPIGMRVNNVDYWFTKNQQGDIVRVENEDGSKYVNYTYDAWGNVDIEYNVATSLLYIFYRNVFTYRGYVYDRDIGMYYLQSRYYDTVVGRFLNADDTDYLGASGTTLGYNLYAYCENNAVVFVDPFGFAKYNGYIGFGMQIVLIGNLFFKQFIYGVDLVWYSKENNFGNGSMPWIYGLKGGSIGISFDLTKLFSTTLLTSTSTFLKSVLKSSSLQVSLSIGLTFFVVTGDAFQTPWNYVGGSYFDSLTVAGVTISKSSSARVSTYGVGATFSAGFNGWSFSVGTMSFGYNKGYVNYTMLAFNSNAMKLYNSVKKRV